LLCNLNLYFTSVLFLQIMSVSSLSNSPSQTMAIASKQHSLFISTTGGPRPLRLVDSNTLSPQGPSTAPLDLELSSPSSSKCQNLSSRPASRRQSSISYISGDRYYGRDLGLRSPLSPSIRHSSIGSSKLPSAESSPRDWNNADTVVDTQERPPLTLVEQYSELLHTIAQKEAICLELRSQLATHEAELLQLKRKWERIMNRGCTSSSSPSTSGPGATAMLDGIKGGVQGVSRFLAASIGESLSPTINAPVPIPNLRSSNNTHVNSLSGSNSSISTHTTKSTRFSQSSTSSLGDENQPPCVPMNASQTSSSSSDDNVLIVHDTGATPTVSPNPDFIRRQQRREERRHQVRNLADNPRADLHRRISRGDENNSPSLALFQGLEGSAAGSIEPAEEKEAWDDEKKTRYTSMNLGSFPPISSMPGLGSLMTGTVSQPVSSWVDTMGKKFEELQKGSTFTSSQKRASLLLSDVSQSIASVLSPSPLPPTASSPSSKFPTPAYFTPLPTSPLTACTTPSSLLDEDNEDLPTGSLMVASPMMTPEIRPSIRRKYTSLSNSSPCVSTHGGIQDAHESKKGDDDEEEWNW